MRTMRLLTCTIHLVLKQQKCSSTVGFAKTSVPHVLVVVAVQASIWNHAVLRGDLNNITIGQVTNVQDRTVIHAARSVVIQIAALLQLVLPACH